jgi:MFS family permease
VSVVEQSSVIGSAAPSRQSLLALGWLNFFLSGMQTAFGPIAAAYLAAQGWTAKDIGFVLSIGAIASLVSQVPGGALIDAVRAKRLLVATGVTTIALSTLIFRLWPSFSLVALAEIFQGITGGVLGPAVIAITLGLVGQAKLAERLGQNQRRGRRRRGGYPDDGPRRVFRVALGNVRSRRARRSSVRRHESDPRQRD